MDERVVVVYPLLWLWRKVVVGVDFIVKVAHNHDDVGCLRTITPFNVQSPVRASRWIVVDLCECECV